MDPRRASIPAWARVTIHLNLWDVPAATDAATAALKVSRLHSGSTFRYGRVTGSADIPPRWCYLNPAARLAVVNQEVWEKHCGYASMGQFCSQIRDSRMPRFVRYDEESWGLADQLMMAENDVPTNWWPRLTDR